MPGIDDWYADREAREEQDPRYDLETDDVRDPFQFGEVPPQHPWTPQLIPDRGTSSSVSRHTGRRRMPGSGDWRMAVKQWLERNPGKSYKACRDALAVEGYRGISRRMVAEVARSSSGPRTERSDKRRPKSGFGKQYVPRPIDRSAAYQPRQVVCPACDLVVTDSGYCRCG